MVTQATQRLFVFAALSLAGCGTAQEPSKSSERSPNYGKPLPGLNGSKSVSMSFALPTDISRAKPVKSDRAHTSQSTSSKKPVRKDPATQEDQISTLIAQSDIAPVETNPDLSNDVCFTGIDENGVVYCACEPVPPNDLPVFDPVETSTATSTRTSTDLIDCNHSIEPFADNDATAHDAEFCQQPEAIALPLEQESRIQISCADGGFGSLAKAERFRDLWLYENLLWAAPVLRMSLEEQTGDVISQEIMEFPYFCPGNALIQVVGLATGATYRIGAEVLDFNWNLQYVGSTERFKVSESSTTMLPLPMQRYRGDGTGNVIVDVIFDQDPRVDTRPVPAPGAARSPNGLKPLSKTQ